MFEGWEGATVRLTGMIVCAAVLAGCANQNSIFRYNRVRGSDPAIVTMDAKQRNFFMVREGESPNAWRVCAEASPDVFSALSTSASADLGFGAGGGARTEAQARAALAIAEAAGTIERTQTINMLRESMYRTCERYMSGAIDRATFVVQAGRDWRAMIAILAIEQLTRTARPPSTIISAGSTSANVESGTDVLRQVALAEDEVSRTSDRLREAQDSEPATCPPTEATPETTAACADKGRRTQRAQEDHDRAKQNLDSWRVIANNPPPARSQAETGQGPNQTGGGGDASSETALATVAPVVGEIVRRAFDTDETQLFCLQVLSPQSGLQVDERLKTRCTDYLLAVVEAEGALLLQRGDLRHRGFAEAMEVRTATDELLAYLRRLTPAQYEGEAATIRTVIPSFCTRAASLEQCIRLIGEGGLDAIDPALIRRALQARSQQGGRW